FYRSSIFVLRFSHCLLLSPPPTPTLFPYTTLFRSVVVRGDNFSSDDETFTATAVDRHPTSPTFFEAASRGGYGKVTKIENIRTLDRKSTRLNSSHVSISYADFCLKKKNTRKQQRKT